MEMMPQRKQPAPPSPEPVTPSPLREVENVAPMVPGGVTVRERKKYTQYLADQAGSGDKPLSFEQWMASQKK